MEKMEKSACKILTGVISKRSTNGAGVGESVGALVGLNVGAIVGDSDGLFVGINVGILLGLLEGVPTNNAYAISYPH